MSLRHPVSALALGPRGWIQTSNFTLTGTLFLAAIPVFFGLPAAALTCGWRSWRSWRAGQRTFALYIMGTSVTMLTTMMLAGAGFGQSPGLVDLSGLFQRVSIVTRFAWLTVLSARELRHLPTPGPACPPAGG